MAYPNLNLLLWTCGRLRAAGARGAGCGLRRARRGRDGGAERGGGGLERGETPRGGSAAGAAMAHIRYRPHFLTTSRGRP